jgi:SAM-dependent methyltransferase
MALEYTTADLSSAHASIHVDLANGPEALARLGRARYDFVLCSHVLEHIPDDTAAIRTLTSLAAPNGELLIQVPLDRRRTTTYEDWHITTPAARAAAFGQEDHVRVYGTDFTTRLESGGLRVTPLHPSAEQVARMHLDPNDPIYLCSADRDRATTSGLGAGTPSQAPPSER